MDLQPMVAEGLLSKFSYETIVEMGMARIALAPSWAQGPRVLYPF